MGADVQNAGIALVCDEEGTILQVIRDDLGIADRAASGRSVTSIVDRGSLEKALSFLDQLRTQGTVFDWELNVPVADEVATLHFAGVATGGQLLIFGAKTSNGVMQLYEEMMRIGNEQANALRAAMKEYAELTRDQAERDRAFYDELSRLNNELANLQRELAKKNVALERLNEQKNRFLGMAAHDLRTPLSAMMSYSEFLLDEASDVLDEEHIEFLSIIHSSSQFMGQLVDELLDVSTIESGKLELDRRPTDLVNLVVHNVALNRVLAEKKDIDLSFRRDGEFAEMMVDARKIEQVLSNLISNAIKYSHSHTTVEVSLARRGDDVLIAVKDQGQGIPAEELDGLFEMFGRTSVKTTGGEKSTGLGLAIAHRIVVEHGGEIEVDSEVGTDGGRSGTTFTVSLPVDLDHPAEAVPEAGLERDAAAEARREPGPSAGEGPGPTSEVPLRILLAEDDDGNRRLAVRMIERRGHAVVAVEDGRAAVDAWQEGPFDLILMDMHMPEMDGAQATAAIRERERVSGARTPIVALTASVMEEDVERLRAAGMDAYVLKPLQDHELTDIVRDLLSARMHARSTESDGGELGEM